MTVSKIFLCVAGAATAGVVTGVLLTSGKGAKWMQGVRKTTEGLENKNGGLKTNEASETAHQRAEFNQASSLGLS